MKPREWPDRRWVLLYLLAGLVPWFGFGVVMPGLGVEVSPASAEEPAPWWRIHIVAASAVAGGMCACLAMHVTMKLVRARALRKGSHNCVVREFWVRRLVLPLFALLLFITDPVLRALGMLPLAKLEPVVFCTIAALMLSSFFAGDAMRHPFFSAPDSRSRNTET